MKDKNLNTEETANSDLGAVIGRLNLIIMNRIENVYDVTQRLCGLIEPQGETTIDEIRFLNLQDTISLTEKLIDDIESVARHSNRSEFSMSKAGKEANEFIKLLRERFQ